MKIIFTLGLTENIKNTLQSDTLKTNIKHRNKDIKFLDILGKRKKKLKKYQTFKNIESINYVDILKINNGYISQYISIDIYPRNLL